MVLLAVVEEVLLRDLAVFLLTNPHQAPWALLQFVSQIIEVLGCHPYVLHGFGYVLIIRPNELLNGHHGAVGLIHNGLQLNQVVPNRIAKLVNCEVYVGNGRIGMLN
jgi:hypothetical protein